MPDYTIGVDLGGTNLRIAAVDEQGRLIEKLTLGTQVALGRDRVVRDMCDAIQRVANIHKGSGALRGDRDRCAGNHRHEDGHDSRVAEPSGLG